MLLNIDKAMTVSRLLATSPEILIASAIFSVALATSWSQFQTLCLLILIHLLGTGDETPQTRTY